MLGNPTLANGSGDVLNQPLISAVCNFAYSNGNYTCTEQLVYLNNPIRDFSANYCALKTVSFPAAGISASAPYSFDGCENLSRIRLPRVEGGSIPRGLFAGLESDDFVLEVPSDVTGEHFRACLPGVIDLTYTGYDSIEAEAFKDTTFHTLIAPLPYNDSAAQTFTIESNAFTGCNIQSVDLRNVGAGLSPSLQQNSTVVINEAFTGATIARGTAFNWGPANDSSTYVKVEMNANAFESATFTDNNFTLSPSLSVLGESAFANCSTLHNVSVSGDLDMPYLTEISNHAFQFAKNLSTFPFENMISLSRIGSYAFGMIDKSADHDKAGVGNTAFANQTITLPETDTLSIGEAAFNSTHLVGVNFNSKNLIWENGTNQSGFKPGGHQFRYCSNLQVIRFKDYADGTWTDLSTNQDNYFSDCVALQEIYMPSFFDVSNNSSNNSMMWRSNSAMIVYTPHGYLPKTRSQWRQTQNGSWAEIYYFVDVSTDAIEFKNGSYSSYSNEAYYWTKITIDGVLTQVKLGQVSSVDAATGEVTFIADNGMTIVFGTSGLISVS